MTQKRRPGWRTAIALSGFNDRSSGEARAQTNSQTVGYPSVINRYIALQPKAVALNRGLSLRSDFLPPGFRDF